MSWIATIVHVFIAIVLISAAQLAKRPPVRDLDGTYTLRHGPVILIMGLAFLAGGCFFMSMLSLNPPTNAGTLWAVLGMCAIFVSAGLVLLAEYRFLRVAVSDQFIEARSLWTGTRRIPWPDVSRVNHGTMSRDFIFSSSHGTTIRVNSWMTGIASFVTDVRRRLPESIYLSAADAFDEVCGTPRIKGMR